MGTLVYDIKKGEVSANIGNMPLNCLLFQDDIAKMNQLKNNVAKSKLVVIGSKKSREKCLKRAEKNSIKKGDLVLEKSTTEKYLGNKIYEDGTAARKSENK